MVCLAVHVRWHRAEALKGIVWRQLAAIDECIAAQRIEIETYDDQLEARVDGGMRARLVRASRLSEIQAEISRYAQLRTLGTDVLRNIH